LKHDSRLRTVFDEKLDYLERGHPRPRTHGQKTPVVNARVDQTPVGAQVFQEVTELPLNREILKRALGARVYHRRHASRSDAWVKTVLSGRSGAGC
jgi:hypothetical protein